MKRTKFWAAVLVGIITGMLPGFRSFAGSHAEQIYVRQEVPNQEKLVYVTGSRLPQRVKVKYIGTDTPWNVTVIGQHEIEISGRQTVAGVLAREPSVRISRGR
jgi:outer membrane cobalamin receptor